MRSRLVAIGFGVGLVVVGAGLGAIAMRAYDLKIAATWLRSPSAERRNTLLLGILDRRLDLDDSQRVQLTRLLDSQTAELEAVRASVAPEQAKLRQDILTRSAAFLTPDQLQRLERIMAAVRAREVRRSQP